VEIPEQHIVTDEAKFNVLTEVCSFINSSMPNEQQLQAIVEAANRLIGVKDSSLIMVNEQSKLLYFHVATGEKSQEIRKLTMQPGEGIAGWVIEHGVPTVVPDVTNDSRFSPRIGEVLKFETKSILCVPIRSGSKVIGAFEAVNRLDGKPFEDKDVSLLTAFVALIRMVLENSEHQREVEQANIELEKLVQSKTAEVETTNKSLTTKTQRLALTTKIISLINSNQSMADILVGVVEQLRRLILLDYATVALLQGGRDAITLLELYPQPLHSMSEEVEVSFDDPVINYVVHYKRALFHNRPRWYHCFLEEGRFLEKRLETMFCTPILSSDTVWGTLNLGSVESHQYPREVVDIVTFVATQIGVAFERDKMRKTLEEMNQELNEKTFELRKSIIKMGDANLKLFDMQQQLREKDKKMENLLHEVQEKNEELNNTLAELKQTQTQLVQSEKMASLGQLVAGIAHELNTPAGAIKAASEIIPDYIQKTFTVYDKLSESNMSLSHRKLIQELVGAMVESAKEQERKSTAKIREQSRVLTKRLQERGVKNSRLIAKDIARCYLDHKVDTIFELFDHYGSESIMEFLNNCNRVLISSRDNQLSVGTISKIVRALKSYSYLDQSQERSVELNEDIENTLTILHSQIPSNIKIIRKFGILPKITCLGSELNQVWTNIIQNALQALEDQGGTITVETFADSQYVTVKITDDGNGISDEIKDKIFDPFFTTKRGKTTGLGLSITHQIIAKHQGTIRVDSIPGNTSFEIMLPKEGIKFET